MVRLRQKGDPIRPLLCLLAGCLAPACGNGGGSASLGAQGGDAAGTSVDALGAGEANSADVAVDRPRITSDAGSTGGADTGGDAYTAEAGDGGAFDAAAEGASLDASGASAGRSQDVYMTFYGWPDNSPPGNAISYPKNGGFPTVHNAAGGTGTPDDPITFATDKAEFPVGTLLYAPVIEKYLVMEDDCVECDSDWSGSMKWHIDVWMNSSGTASSSAVLSCEDHWTQTSTTIEVNPPPGRTVTTAPLFDTATNACRTSP